MRSRLCLWQISACAALSLCRGPLPGAPPEAPAQEAATLASRIKELEEKIASARSAAAAGLPRVPALLGHIDSADGPALTRDLERLLLAGEPGFATIHQYFEAADLDHPKILRLTHENQLVLGMLRIIARRPDEVASLCRYLIKSTKSRTESFTRREIFNFIPNFLKYHRGKYPELRSELEEDLLYQLDRGGEYSNKVFIAFKDLGFHPPPERFVPLLKNPALSHLHSPLILYIGDRGKEGLKALVQFVKEAPDTRSPAVRDALLKASSLTAEGGGEAILPFLESKDPALATAATRAYFNQARDLAALPLAVRYLNSAADLKERKALLGLLGRRNDRLLAALASSPEQISDPVLREQVKRTGKGSPGAPPAGAPVSGGAAPSSPGAPGGGESRKEAKEKTP